MSRVASATACKRQMPMPATKAISNTMTRKPRPKRIPILRFFKLMTLFFYELAG
ncbi:hypothetical protein D3C78_1864030 [compost metagenome]